VAVKRIKRPRDPISLAKLIGDIATGQVEDKTDDGKDAATARLDASRPWETYVAVYPSEGWSRLPRA
jgi:hypothetical protein